MRFAKLTKLHGGQPVYVNPATVIRLEANLGVGDGTPTGGTDCVHWVTEYGPFATEVAEPLEHVVHILNQAFKD